jgi:hypothetical protein
MITAIPFTLNLLILIGLYELAAGIAGLTGRINWRTLLDEIERSPALTFMTGFVVYVVGAVVVLTHCIWTDALAIIVSAIGCIATVEGLLLMTAPGPLFAFSRRLVVNQKSISMLAASFGLVLIGLGLTGRADPVKAGIISKQVARSNLFSMDAGAWRR